MCHGVCCTDQPVAYTLSQHPLAVSFLRLSLPLPSTFWQTPVNIVPLPVSMCYSPSVTTYKWEHGVVDFCSCIGFLRITGSDSIHLPAKDRNASFLWLYSIPWCLCTPLSLSSLLLMGIWVDSMSLLLWIVQQRAYTYMYLYNKMIFPSGICPVMGLLGQTVILPWGRWGIIMLSSRMDEPIYTPADKENCSFFSTTSAASVVFFLTF